MLVHRGVFLGSFNVHTMSLLLKGSGCCSVYPDAAQCFVLRHPLKEAEAEEDNGKLLRKAVRRWEAGKTSGLWQ